MIFLFISALLDGQTNRVILLTTDENTKAYDYNNSWSSRSFLSVENTVVGLTHDTESDKV